jgi:hypothetical protein
MSYISTMPEAPLFAASPFAGEGISLDGETGAVLADSVTRLTREAEGAIVVTGSHGGVYAAVLVGRVRARAAIFNDASVGKDAAGIAGLAYLDRLGLPALAVGHRSARIGHALDTLEIGVVSFVNRAALRLGCRAGLFARECLTSLVPTESAPRDDDLEFRETRVLASDENGRVWALDSVSLVRDDDRHDILITGSHGALLGGRPETALKKDALAAVFNDAGGGPDGRGRTRLQPLDQRGIAAATVYAASARIGDGRSTYRTGRLSSANETARTLGAEEGMSVKEFVRVVGSRR